MKKKLTYDQLIILIVMILLLIFIVLPVWTAISVSFMTNGEAINPTTYLFPTDFSLIGYQTLFKEAELIIPLKNTLFVTIIGTFIHMLVVSLAAYALIQRNIPGKKYILSFFLLTMMVPSEAIMIPRYIMFSNWGMINNLWSVILISMAGGFSIILMENYFKDVPDSLAESARIDGTSEFKIFYKLYIPLAKNGFLVVMLFDIVSRWNEYSNALLLLNKPEFYLIQQAIKSIVLPAGSGDSSFQVYPNVEMAVIVIGMIPVLALYIIFQKQFSSNIAGGGVKG